MYKLTRRVLEILVPRGYRVLITTKSSLVARDADILAEGNAAVTITVTTMDDVLAKRLEPGAPPPSERIEAMRELVEHGVPVGLRLDPILPGINDSEESIEEVLKAAREAGVRFVVTSTYKARPDNLKRVLAAFPHLRELYKQLYLRKGRWIRGYWYLPEELRREIILRVRRAALRLSFEFATCREGFVELHTAASCDGSHLIPERLPPPGGVDCKNGGVSLSRLGVSGGNTGLRPPTPGSKRR